MIIECPACQSRYRIREEKLPSGGGNIKCPNCAHVFFVNMPVAGAPAAAPVASVPPPIGAPPVAAGGTMMMAPPPPIAAAAPGPVAAPITGVNAAIGQKWKLKNPIGLIYDFADTESLRRWLQAREALDGLQASRDNGASWEPLENVEELRDIKATGRKTVAGMAAISGGVDPRAVAQIAAQNASAAPAPPPNPEVLREQAQARLEQARKTRDGDSLKIPQAPASSAAAPAAATGRVEKQKKAAALLRKEEAKEASTAQTVGAIVILVVAIGVFVWGLNSAGIIQLGRGGDASTSLPTGPAPTPPSALTPPTADAGAAPAVGGRSRLGDRERAAEALDRASTAMNTGDNESAIGYLERAAYLDPENRELACQLALLYLRQNRTEEAAAARRRCEGTDAAAAPTDEAAAGEPTGIQDGDPGATLPDDGAAAPADPGTEPGQQPNPEEEQFEGPNIVETRIITGSGSGSTAN